MPAAKQVSHRVYRRKKAEAKPKNKDGTRRLDLTPYGNSAVEKQRQRKADGTAKRMHVDPVTCERDYAPDELEFMFAMHAYRQRYNRPFPTWSEALVVLKTLGYAKAPTP